MVFKKKSYICVNENNKNQGKPRKIYSAEIVIISN